MSDVEVIISSDNVVEVVVEPVGGAGPPGSSGWSPLFSVSVDGERRVMQVTDWVGGEGEKPAVGAYLSEGGLVSGASSATDIRGGTGVQGEIGNSGWSPALSIVSDNDRRVLQVSGWVGGQGVPPSTGEYVGLTGLVSAIAGGVDIRGAAGASGSGTGDMTKSVYDTNDSGAVDVAETAPWSGLTDVPSIFPPDAHSHGIGEVTGLQAALDGKADSGQSFSGSYGDLTGIPSSFPPSSHTHLISSVAGLQNTLDAKADVSAIFSGAYADLTGSPSLGTAAAQNVSAFATSAQGEAADTALQSGDLDALASEAEAEAGTATEPRRFSPLRIRQAVEALASSGSEPTEYVVSPNTSAVTIPIVGFQGFKIWFFDDGSSSASRSFALLMSSDGTNFPTSQYSYRNDESQINNSSPNISSSTFAANIPLTGASTLDAVFGVLELSNVVDAKARGTIRGNIGTYQRSNKIWAAKSFDFAPVALRFIASSGVFSGGRIAVQGIGGAV